MKKLILVSTFIFFAITSSFAFQSPVTCSVQSYDDAGAIKTQYVTVQQNCDIILEARISTVGLWGRVDKDGFAVAQYGSTSVYTDSNRNYASAVKTNVSAGSTIYLHALVGNHASGWSYARVTFGSY